MRRNMYDISLDLEIKNSAEIYYCARHSTDVTLAIIKFPVPLKIQRTAYTRILPLKWLFHLRDNCVLSKEFYPTQYLRPGCLFMTSNSILKFHLRF